METISPLKQTPANALRLSQQTAHFLQNNSSYTAFNVPIPFWSNPESSKLWGQYENFLLSCLRTGDDKGAFLCLERLIERFGTTNEKVMGLRGLYQEAVAEDEAGLEKILREYNEVLVEDPVNTVRFLGILRFAGR